MRECTAHIKVGSARDDTEVYKGRESPAWFTKFFYPVSCFTSKAARSMASDTLMPSSWP